MKVNIYLYHTIKTPKQSVGVQAYILECETNKGPATMGQVATLEASKSTADMQVLLNALRQLNKPCELTIYTESSHLATALKQWVPKWKLNNWTNAKGAPIAAEWKEIAELLHEKPFEIVTAKHSFTEWMHREAYKRLEKEIERKRDSKKL